MVKPGVGFAAGLWLAPAVTRRPFGGDIESESQDKQFLQRQGLATMP